MQEDVRQMIAEWIFRSPKGMVCCKTQGNQRSVEVALAPAGNMLIRDKQFWDITQMLDVWVKLDRAYVVPDELAIE
jgi:hypothetical protein